MTQVILNLPDDLAHLLAAIAAGEHKTVEQLASDHLRSLASKSSPAALLRAIAELPHLSDAEVADIEAAIAAGRLPVRDQDPFQDDQAE